LRTFRSGSPALKLVEVAGKPAPTQGLVNTHIGVGYIAFAVGDIDAVYNQLTEAGAEFSSENLPLEPDQGVGRQVIFHNPDGNLLELYGD